MPLAHQLVADGTIRIIYEETFTTVTDRLRAEVRAAADALRDGTFELKPVGNFWKDV